jgi:hypothetical protein
LTAENPKIAGSIRSLGGLLLAEGEGATEAEDDEDENVLEDGRYAQTRVTAFLPDKLGEIRATLIQTLCVLVKSATLR